MRESPPAKDRRLNHWATPPTRHSMCWFLLRQVMTLRTYSVMKSSKPKWSWNSSGEASLRY